MKESEATMGQSGGRGARNPRETFGQALAAAVGSSFIWDCFGSDVQRAGWMGFLLDDLMGPDTIRAELGKTDGTPRVKISS